MKKFIFVFLLMFAVGCGSNIEMISNHVDSLHGKTVFKVEKDMKAGSFGTPIILKKGDVVTMTYTIERVN